MNTFLKMISKFAVVIILLLSSINIFSQTVSDSLLVNEVFQYNLNVTNFYGGDVPSIDGNISGGQGEVIQIDNENYIIEFIPNADYLGTVSFQVEYDTIKYIPPFNFPAPSTNVLNFNLTYQASIVEAEDDAVLISSMDDYIILPLGNDTITLNEGYELFITQVNSATADLSQDTIIYHPESDLASDYINYTLVDSLGTYSRGTIYLVYEDFDVEAIDTLYYKTSNTGSLILLMPHGGFSQTSNNEVGNVSAINSAVFKYSIESDTVLTDELHFTALNGDERVVYIDILLAEDEGDLVEDDVYTAKNTSISFNPLENDNTFNDITDYSPELVLSTGNTLTYTPVNGYTGVKKFWYEVDFGTHTELEDIYIYVGNLEPQNTINYNLTTLLNTDIVISYDIPLEGFYFEELNSPAHGSISIESGEVNNDCNEYSLESYIRYTPFLGYSGTDEFSVKYCIESTNTCKNYKVYVNVLNETAADCNCEGPDCVWAGDTNKDGRVSVRDILPLGMEFGRVGASRDNATAWLGEYGDDWNSDYYQDINSKFADANGDGVIDVDDVNSIDENYSKVHNFVPNENYYLKDYPLILDFQQTEVDSGDLLVIDVILGNENYPVLDLEGFAFRMTVAQGIADSASMNCVWPNDTWLAKNASNISLSKVPVDGTLDAGFARSSGLPSSGYGIIATLSFIVEDELEGFKLKDNDKVEFSVNLTEVVGQDPSGKLISLPDASGTVTLNLKSKEDNNLDIDDLIVYPNPATNNATIHMNSGHVIYNIQLLDLQGRVYNEINSINNNNYQLDLSTAPRGLYILNIATDKGTLSRKLMIEK